MTHDHNDTLHAIFNAISGEGLDFDLMNRNRGLPACFSVIFLGLSKFHYQKWRKPNWVLWIFVNLLFMDSWKWSKWAIYKFIRLEILFLLTYYTQAKDIPVVKSGTRNDFRSSCLYVTRKKLSPWHTFSNMAKIRPP